VLSDREDAFGHGLFDYLHGKGGAEIVERDDGLFDVSGGPSCYFLEYDNWPDHQKRAIVYAKGRALDIGCGAGRHLLYLQSKGLKVVGVDNSPLALEVCRARGLTQLHLLSITQITSSLGVFDTILMMGNNFGLFANRRRTKWLLRRFHRITSADARILAETTDPYATTLQEHLEYHELNRQRDRIGCQIRIRVRYRKYATPWFDYLMVSKDEMKELLEDTGWRLAETVDGVNGRYIGIMGKDS
jgi:SAM-dependent methyltransferase